MVEPILRAPLNVEWEITKECNLQCRHCYTSAGKKEPKELSTDEAISMINHLDAVGISDITISGGEPLLRKDLEVIINHLKELELPFILYTNGILLNAERQSSLKKAGVHAISLSLNGTTKKTHNYVHNANTYDIIMKRINQLKKNGFGVQALYTLMGINIKEALGLPELIEEMGLDSVCVYPFYPAGRGADYLSQFEVPGDILYNTIDTLIAHERIYLGGCLQGIFKGSTMITGSPCARLMCLVTPEGKLRPCNFLPFQTEKSLLEENVYTLWKSPVFEKVRNWQNIVHTNCDTCEYVKTCRGKCLAFHMPFLQPDEIDTLST
jgi:radical SAM protein with 4Fe4S-binding SPASM domain